MAEKEYIEKSKLISDIECIDICDCTDIDDIFIEVERTIDEQPTADVQEVRHGKWVKSDFDVICSICGYIESAPRPFCSECGAKMDKE